jgi:prepilin-type N-terminal cleavage/methylation domain-containing protein
MNSSVRTGHAARGFSMVELLVTIVIASLVFAALVPVFVNAMKLGSSDKSRVVAFNMAQQAVESCRRMTFEQVVSATWTQDEVTATGKKPFTVERTVVDDAAASPTGPIVSKQVSVTVSWSRPSPGGSTVVKTVLYRQLAGPQIVDFAVDPWDPLNEWITDSTVQLTATIRATDVASMAPHTVGGITLTGYVEFRITSVSGVVIPTIRVPYTSTSAVYTTQWLVPGGPGISDGFWSFKAVAFSAQKYPGNSWEFAKRVESGPPADVTNLVATAGEDWVTLTWSPSISNDLAYYQVERTGPDGIPVPFTPITVTSFTDTPLTKDAYYTYTVYAVDQVPSKRVPLLPDDPPLPAVTVRTGAVVAVQPAPATDLKATYSGSTAVLTWTSSPGVDGYRVYMKNGVTDTWVDVSGPYYSLPQGYESSAWYQVKPYLTGSDLGRTAFASLFQGPPAQDFFVDGSPPVRWAKVTIPKELLFTLNVMNNVQSGKTAVITLKYLGPEGKSSAVTITPTQTIAYSSSEYKAVWAGLTAGVYQFSWMTTNNRSGSRLVTLVAPQYTQSAKCIP